MTQTFSETIASTLKDKRKRNKIILALLCVVLFFLYAYLWLFNGVFDPGPKRYLICGQCENRRVKRIKNIDAERCAECGGVMKFVFKCSNCGIEFPFMYPEIPPDATPKEQVSMYQLETICPQCKSANIRQMRPPESK